MLDIAKRRGENDSYPVIHLYAEKGKDSCFELASTFLSKYSKIGSPPKLLLTKLFAASELAAYRGYASTRNVKMPLKTRRVLCRGSVSCLLMLGATPSACVSHVIYEFRVQLCNRTS